MKPGVELLLSVELLRDCSPGELIILNDIADLARVGPGEMLFREGEQLNELNILLVGQVGALNADARGRAVLSDVILPVRTLCLPAALLGLPAPIAAQTLSSARLIVFPMSDFRAALGKLPSLASPLLECALRESHRLTLDICDLKLRSSAQRLADYLLSLVGDPELSPARFVLPFEKRLLAARIGCSQENLSRAFAALRRLGVETQRGVVVLRDVPSLRSFAGPARPDPIAS